MTHKRRTPRVATPPHYHVGTCPDCGKLRFTTRRNARARIRLMGDRMSAYPCGDFWHIGHLLMDIIQGSVGREVYHEFTPEELDEVRNSVGFECGCVAYAKPGVVMKIRECSDGCPNGAAAAELALETDLPIEWVEKEEGVA